jgi:hypothetical protein
VRAGVIGAIVGAVISSFFVGSIVIVLVLTGRLDALRTVDALTFAFVVVGVVITALTVVGSFTLIQTWNDIDKRTQAIVEKYERDAKAELARDAEERRKAIDESAERGTAAIHDVTAKAVQISRNTRLLLGAFGASVMFISVLTWLRVERFMKQLGHSEQRSKQ